VNACGVAVAMLQGHSWTPTLSNGWKVNVGTIPPVRANPANDLPDATTQQPQRPAPTYKSAVHRFGTVV